MEGVNWKEEEEKERDRQKETRVMRNDEQRMD